MKTKIILIVLLYFVYSCNSTKTKQTNKKPITVENAFFQNWYGGRKGVRGVRIKISGKQLIKDCKYTTIYYLNKTAKLDAKIENEIVSLEANINTSKRSEMLSVNVYDEYNNKPPTKVKYPNLSSNEAIIEYRINNELRFMKIALTQKESQYYP